MPFIPEQPHNALPQLPPKADIETRHTLRGCVGAARALAELKAAGDIIPNQTILINAIPLHEAQLSSEIENIVTTQDALYKADLYPDKANAYTKEVLHYREALLAGYKSLKDHPLSERTFLEVCSTLLDKEMTIRADDVVLKNPATDTIIYTPPRGRELLQSLLSNLQSFFHNDTGGIDPLIRMAVAHYQFEAIHPFSDGNGRTGRIFNLLYLIEKKLLSIPVLYLSGYIIDNKNEYYRLLGNVTEAGEWESWIIFMLEAVKKTAEETTEKIRNIQKLFESVEEKIHRELPRIDSHRLTRILFEQPYCRTRNLVDGGLGTRITATKYLNRVAEVGVLDAVTFGKEKLYINSAFLEVLEKR